MNNVENQEIIGNNLFITLSDEEMLNLESLSIIYSVSKVQLIKSLIQKEVDEAMEIGIM